MSYDRSKLMESLEGHNALFLYATEGILVIDDRGKIIRINPSAERLFGYSPNELLNQKIEVLIPQRMVERHEVQRNSYQKKPQARAMGTGRELFGLKKDNTEFPIEISLSPYNEIGKNYVIAFIVDITVRKQAEDKMRNYSAELEKQVKNRTLILEEAIVELEKTKVNLRNALEKEKDLNELKSRFVSMASHEFRTPLTTMLSSLSLVTKYAEQNDKENQERHVIRIKNSINHLTDILNDFLSVSKLEEGKLQNFPQEINLKALIDEILAEMKGTLLKGQKLVFTHLGEETALLDPKLLRHILFNLISNAIKFSPEGKAIEVSSVKSNSIVKIAIKDSGVGIPKEDQKHLFERFFRAQNVTHIQGTGLGLNIVTKYTELMNGNLDFESEENRGTTFTVILPQ